MKNFFLLMVASLLVVLFSTSSLYAGTIEKGTFAVGAGSNMLFFNQDSDYDENPNYDADYKIFNFSIDGSYFVIPNLELGLQWDYFRRNDNTTFISGHGYDDYNNSEFTLAPFIGYHLPITPSSNIFFRAGLGIGKSQYDFDSPSVEGLESDITIFMTEAGWEFFVNSNIALNIGLKYENKNLDHNIRKDETISKFGGDLRLRLYF